MNKVQKFRKILAEQGTEMTIQEAEKSFEIANKFIKKSKKFSMMDIWAMEEMQIDGVSEEEKQQLINIYKKAKEM